MIAIIFFGLYLIYKLNSLDQHFKKIFKINVDNFIDFNNTIFQYIYHYLNFKYLNNKIEPINDNENINMLYPFKSRPLDFEDIILFYIFPDIKHGFYIDFGGYHPENYSVTKFFYDLGWYGINIEPVPEFYSIFVKNRPRDINLNVCGGENNGNCTLYVKKDVTSVIKGKFGKSNKIITIKQLTAKKICETYIPKHQNINFCKIDVEGAEKSILLGFDFENFKPNVFVIESLEDKDFQSWEYILFNNSYEYALTFGRNRYYFNSKLEGMRERFIGVKEKIILYKKEFFKRNKIKHKKIF